MSGLDGQAVAALAAVALLAGFVDAIAGGGGLMTVPALLLAGLDPVQAIATNKLQGTFGTASATLAFARAKLIDWRRAWEFALAAATGSVLGALSATLVPRAALEALIPVLLIAMAIYFARSRKIVDADARARLSALLFGGTVPVAIGFYDGLFGPGAGSFYMLAFVTLLGYGAVRATAHTKLLNFASNAGSFALFAATGAVVWPVGLVMAASALVGAQIGSRLAVRLGSRLIRPLLVGVSGAMALRLVLDPANPLHRLAASLF